MIFSSIFWKNRVCFVAFYVKICDKFTLTQKKDHGRSTKELIQAEEIIRAYFHTLNDNDEGHSDDLQRCRKALTALQDLQPCRFCRQMVYPACIAQRQKTWRFVQHATKYYIADVDAEISSSSDCVFHDLVLLTSYLKR